MEVTKNLLFQQRNFKHVLILETTLSAIDSPLRDLSDIQPTQMNSKYYLIFDEPYEMFQFAKFVAFI